MAAGFPDLYMLIYQRAMKIAISWQEIAIFLISKTSASLVI